MYAQVAWKDYSEFVAWLDTVRGPGQISDDEFRDLLSRYPDPKPKVPPEWEEEAEVESYLRDPPDPGPLAKLPDHGWIDDATASALRLAVPDAKRLLNLSDEEVVVDIQENALHIVGRCANPKDWDKNRTGLVYGMVQSGKTASMISVIEIARRAGYRLFILLAGDKNSLRNQTQDRVNASFGLENGVNKALFVHSPTWQVDFRDLEGGYLANFQTAGRFGRNQDWTTIIVIKKNTHHLQELVNQLKHLQAHLKTQGKEFEAYYPALILDDEADYASPNTDTRGAGSTIHGDIVALRDALPRNTYVGYTATPQACLSADPNDKVGYPEDFFWLLEPYMDQKDGLYTPRTYLGAWEVFWVYDAWIVRRMHRDEWPHYEKDRKGKSLGIWVPPAPGESRGAHSDGSRPELDALFLEEVLSKRRPAPQSLRFALLDFMIACGIRWWRHWRKSQEPELPSRDHITAKYPHVAAMVHLTESQPNQDKVRRLVQREWADAVAIRKSFSSGSAATHEFRQRWNLQAERTKEITNATLPRFEDVAWFVDKCIEVVEQPINNHRETPYRPYPGNPFVYLLNSTAEGMELFYDDNDPPEIRTKKAAILVGGNILSRGLTIEGLSVTVFGRASQMPLGDATLQMGRWFGHKMSTIDLVSIFVQEEIQEVMAQVAEADRYLRLQIKDAIMHGHQPKQVLLEMKNSAFFRITSPSKSAFLQKDKTGMGFAGRLALLNEPSYDPGEILHNHKTLQKFREKHGGKKVHKRALLFKDVAALDAIKLLKDLNCPDDASQVSFSQYADYLKGWLDGSKADLPDFPSVNIAIWDGVQRRRRVTSATRPSTAEEARSTATTRFGPIIGGQGSDGAYKGDAFLDKDEAWHKAQKTPKKDRGSDDDILIVFYSLDPNYVTKKLFDKATSTWRTQEVRLQKGDRFHVSLPGYKDDDLAVVTFAAWTPSGGPMYGLSTNKLIDVSNIKQRGREQLDGSDAEE